MAETPRRAPRACADRTSKSHRRSIEIPTTAAASGKRLVGVIPGKVLTSSRVIFVGVGPIAYHEIGAREIAATERSVGSKSGSLYGFADAEGERGGARVVGSALPVARFEIVKLAQLGDAFR